MAKMYLFRKLSELSQKQSDVCEEAIAGALNDVFKGKTSTIFNYGNWHGCGIGTARDHLVDRILRDLFDHANAMKLLSEISISVGHVLLHVEQNQLLDTDNCNKETREHLVASREDVYSYIEKVIQQRLNSNHGNPPGDYSHVLFTICIRQLNVEKSIDHQGRMQLVNLMSVAKPELLQRCTPMSSLLKIICALAKNSKTHLRYYNIRLTRILKDLLGTNETTVIINYLKETNDPIDNFSDLTCAEVSMPLCIRRGNKWRFLVEKLLILKFWNESGRRFPLVDLLQQSNTQTYQAFEGKNTLMNISPPTSNGLTDRQVQTVAATSFDKLLAVQQIVTLLVVNLERNAQQLEQVKLQAMPEKLEKQRIIFQRKMSVYSDLFKTLWNQQRTAKMLQEKERVMLTKMIDNIYDALHGTHRMHLGQQLESEP